jgi:hypothetical protein
MLDQYILFEVRPMLYGVFEDDKKDRAPASLPGLHNFSPA